MSCTGASHRYCAAQRHPLTEGAPAIVLSNRRTATAGIIPGAGSVTGRTMERRLRIGGRIVSATPKAVRAGDRLHNHSRTWHKQQIERFAYRDLIVCPSVYSGDSQRRSFAGPPYPQNPHIGGIGQTGQPTELTWLRRDSCDAFCKIRTRRIGLCKFVWVRHRSHALSITRTEPFVRRRICSLDCAR